MTIAAGSYICLPDWAPASAGDAKSNKGKRFMKKVFVLLIAGSLLSGVAAYAAIAKPMTSARTTMR